MILRNLKAMRDLARLLSRAFLFSILGLILYLVLSGVVSKLCYGYDSENTLLHAILWPLSRTYWATGFSERNFNLVTSNMNQREVLNLLGEPLFKVSNIQNGNTHWLYSWGVLVTISKSVRRKLSSSRNRGLC